MDLNTVRTYRFARTRDDLALTPGERILGGGTWLFSEPQIDTTGLVDLSGMGWPALEYRTEGLRIGATCTIAELAAIGRPSILVPLPGAIDQDQFANAGVLAKVDGAIRIPQPEFTPERLASEIAALAAEPSRLTAMAANARGAGRLDAAVRLADLVVKVAGI